MEDTRYRITTCLIHSGLYLVGIILPWLYFFELLPLSYRGLTIAWEAGLYIVWGFILILLIMQARKDIKRFKENEAEYVNRRMWKVVFVIEMFLMAFTLGYLVLVLLLIGISSLL
jgi:cytochrome bd-type quinol oxidase subunit 2